MSFGHPSFGGMLHKTRPETPLAGKRFTTTILASISPKSESMSEDSAPEHSYSAAPVSKEDLASEFTLNDGSTEAEEEAAPQHERLSSGQMTVHQWWRWVHLTQTPSTKVQVVTRTRAHQLVKEIWTFQQVIDHLRLKRAFSIFANVFSDWTPPEAELVMDDPSFDWATWNYCEDKWPGWSGYRMVANRNAVSGLHFSVYHQLVYIEDGSGDIRQYHYDTNFLLLRRANLDAPLSAFAPLLRDRPFTDLAFHQSNWSYIPPGCLYSFLSITPLLMSIRNIPLKPGVEPRSVMKTMLRNLPVKDPVGFLYGPKGPFGVHAEARYRDVPFSPDAAIPPRPGPEQPFELPSHPACVVSSLGVPIKPTHEPARRPVNLQYREVGSAITETDFRPLRMTKVEAEEDDEPKPDWNEALWQMTIHERWIFPK